MRRAAWACLLSVACSSEAPAPEAQVLLYVDTDAPLPPPPGQVLELGDHPPLFDSLRVDVFPPGAASACDGCSREIAVDRAMFGDDGASFGILVAEGHDGYRVRLRLYTARHRIDGMPSPYSSIDAFVRLPPVAPGEVAKVHVLLPTDAVATTLGTLDAPIDAEPGAPAGSLVGTWIQQTPCRGAPREGEVCIPGGAYWMGDPRDIFGLAWPVFSGYEQRLVVLSPFFLDAFEVTAGRFAALQPGTFVPWTGSSAGNTQLDFCTWSTEPERADYPMNCVSWAAARSHCVVQGGDLPTEAQYEYVASGLRGDDFVWGNSLPSCDDAVWGLGPIGQDWKSGCKDCRDPQAPPGALPWGTGAADRLALAAGAEVVNVAGSLREWCLDKFRPDHTECWNGAIEHDPLCVTHDPNGLRSIRGGAWNQCPAQMEAALRNGGAPTTALPDLGFRCARADSAD